MYLSLPQAGLEAYFSSAMQDQDLQEVLDREDGTENRSKVRKRGVVMGEVLLHRLPDLCGYV